MVGVSTVGKWGRATQRVSEVFVGMRGRKTPEKMRGIPSNSDRLNKLTAQSINSLIENALLITDSVRASTPLTILVQ